MSGMGPATACQATRAVWEAAGAALVAANRSYAVQLSIRDAHYCVSVTSWWPAPSITRCYLGAVAYYKAQLVLRVQAGGAERIGCYRASETTIKTINLLLGELETQRPRKQDRSSLRLRSWSIAFSSSSPSAGPAVHLGSLCRCECAFRGERFLIWYTAQQAAQATRAGWKAAEAALVLRTSLRSPIGF